MLAAHNVAAMFSWFAFFRDDGAAPPLGAAALDAVAHAVGRVAGLQQGLVMSPTPRTDHPFSDNEPAPGLVLQLQFGSIEALEAAIAADSPLQGVRNALPASERRRVTQQAMLRRRYPVPDPAARAVPGTLPCSFLVHYPGPAADLNAWNGHYNTYHPPLMARFPGVRLVEIYTRMDWVCGLDWPAEHAMQRNKLMFDSPAALTAGLASPVLKEMRADFNRFPAFEGGNVHYALETRVVAAGADPAGG